MKYDELTPEQQAVVDGMYRCGSVFICEDYPQMPIDEWFDHFDLERQQDILSGVVLLDCKSYIIEGDPLANRTREDVMASITLQVDNVKATDQPIRA